MSQAAVAVPDLTPAAKPERPAVEVDAVPTALLAECTCPGWCERDHDRD
jgi:hypothetical protein